MSRADPQSTTFEIASPGRYSLNARFELRHGPQGPDGGRDLYYLTGNAVIGPSVGDGEEWHHEFHQTLKADEIGAKLWEVEVGDESVGHEQQFTLSLQVSDQFRDHYSSMRIFIRRELKHPILD